MTHFEVLSDYLMGSDHAPILCTLGFNKSFRADLKRPEPRFNFKKADWNKFGHVFDTMINQYDLETTSDLNEVFSKLVIESANQSIPKLQCFTQKSYPPHIVSLIKTRQQVRRDKKKVNFENRPILNTEYNRLTSLIKKAIKEYTEVKWSIFLGKLGPYPASSSIFWKIINRARSPKKSSTIPDLIVGARVYKTDEEKANLFALSLGETFTDGGPSTDFGSIIYNYVEDFIK